MRRILTLALLCVLLPFWARAALTVILVRHAETSGATNDPPLLPQGRERAALLADVLRNSELSAIYVSEYSRTQETARPVADRFHIRPTIIEAGKPAELVKAIRQHSAGTVLVVGHSNTLPAIISGLGGSTVSIGDKEFDNLFVVSVTPADASLLRLHYGSGVPAGAAMDMRGRPTGNGRNPIMQITFVRSGGFLGAARRAVKGTVDLKGDHGEVKSDSAYHRNLESSEVSQLQSGADPDELAKAARQISGRTKGAGDLDHYQIVVTTQDGKTHEVNLNTSGASNELQDLSPSVAGFIRWVQQEAQTIQSGNAGR